MLHLYKRFVATCPSLYLWDGKAFPYAHLTFDPFHVMKLVNEALDQVRHQEQKTEPLLKKSRFLWLKNVEIRIRQTSIVPQ